MIEILYQQWSETLLRELKALAQEQKQPFFRDLTIASTSSADVKPGNNSSFLNNSNLSDRTSDQQTPSSVMENVNAISQMSKTDDLPPTLKAQTVAYRKEKSPLPILKR